MSAGGGNGFNSNNKTTIFSRVLPSLTKETLACVDSMGFTQMTPVQAATIPLFLSHKDVLVEATTGSGKTLAFCIPIFEIIRRKHDGDNEEIKKYNIEALVIAPTRELASQIYEVFLKMGSHHTQFRCVSFVGGTSIQENVKEFDKYGGQIVIGTPGRVIDVQSRSALMNFKSLEVLVLDEADTLLDMGFRDSINQILGFLPKQRRTGLFSATQTKEVKELARAGMRNPVCITVRVQHNISVGRQNNSLANSSDDPERPPSSNLQLAPPSTPAQLPQQQQATPLTLTNLYTICEYDQRPVILTEFIRSHTNDKIIVFCSTCACVDFYSSVFAELVKSSTPPLFPSTLQICGFHGKMVPKKRNALYQRFVALTAGVMFSTDVAARGIDIPDVDWIIQLTAPKDPAFFVHRVGRTARAGRRGGALLFVSPEEIPYVALLQGRGVPLQEVAPDAFRTAATATTATTAATSATDRDKSGSHGSGAVDVLNPMKALAASDRAVLEAGSTAFMSFLRAYKENLCPFIFRLEKLNIGAVARAYALLRLPKIPETRKLGAKIDFETSAINTGTIAYKHKEREAARQRKLDQLRAEQAEQQRLQEEQQQQQQLKQQRGDAKTAKKAWIPAEEFAPQEEKRVRKKKQSYSQKLMEEWEDLAAEEADYKRFKKGKLSRKQYEKKLLSIGDDDDDDDDDDGKNGGNDDGSGSNEGIESDSD